MGTLHCRRLHGLILLLVLFLSSVCSLATMMDVSLHGHRKRVLSDSNIHSPSSNSNPDEYTVCADSSNASGKLLPPDFDCDKGDVISEIKFADYGQPSGACGTYKRGKCGARNTLNIIKKKCLGKTKCELPAPDKIFGPTHCKGTIRYVVEVTCKKTQVS
ncbi:hypothetical protein EUTSA_v10029350mg [Eutrema salsugineum]|uniref:SUEL-type lectin domain-containing protein n=1 Tax=Eutrema salsugineum TaxID=72664 RepID=V4KK37_EUTSA|nr:beta-galactosidase 15 [Eutrema salsugineum]ESQ38230.1 hypothetical protein EUTSA_v10029350mg [Eutrema salsugineum]